jgi:4-amino-4-deoxy-L-arabinose transferase-like glycosyltransferase
MVDFGLFQSARRGELLVEALKPPDARTRAAVRGELLVFTAIVVFLALNLPYLEAWPAAHNDEARELNAFWVASGADATARGMDPEFGADPLYKGGLQGLSVGLALRLGGLGLLQGRLVSLAWGGVLLLFTFLLGRRLYGPVAGLVACVCLAVSRPFLVASHMVRPDVVLAAMLVAASYLVVRSIQERERWSALSGGLVLGLALDVHLNAVAFTPLVGLFLVARFGWRVSRALQARLFAVGLAAGCLYFLVVRVLLNPRQFLQSSSYWIGIDKRPPVLSGDLGFMLSSEVGRFQGYFTEDRRLELAVLLIALLLAAVLSVRRRQLDSILLGLAAAFALFVTVVSGKSEFYVALFYPWLVLLLGAAVGEAVSSAGRLGLPLVLASLALAPVVFGAPDNYEDLSTAASNYRERGYMALIDEIRPSIPPGASIIGPPLFWIGLSDHPYTDYYVWERLRAERRERFSSYMTRLKPDIVVLDVKSGHQVAINSPGYLQSNGVLLKSVRHVGYDRVEVWKLS